MKKKICTLLIATSIFCTACGAAPADVSATSEPATAEIATSESIDTTAPEDMTAAVESLNETIQAEIDSIASNYSPQETTKSLKALCEYLESSDLVSGERIEMAGEMIGAISGVKYTDCNVEIYEYDTDSEKYKDLVSTGKVMLEGFNVDITPSAIHNQYVLICDDAPNKDALIDAFNSLD